MANANGSGGIEHVEQALEASYNPRTSNEQRQEALKYLDGLMRSPEAPQYGHSLITNVSLPPQARSFGLALLEESLIRRWNQHSAEEAETIRHWIIDLAQALRPEDPAYLRLKIASLWVVLAERTWGDTWTNLDAMLQELWLAQVSHGQQTCNKTFILYILECLSENICVREDPIAMLRQEALGQSLNEIVIPAGLYAKYKEERDNSTDMRHGTEGWLSRICEVLQSTASLDRSIILRALEALKPTVNWISLEAIVETRCIDCVFQALAYGDDAVRTVAIEVLLAVVSRSYIIHFEEIWRNIYRSTMSLPRIEMLKRTFAATNTDPDDLDEVKYTAQKKLAEVVAHLSDAIPKVSGLLDDDTHALTFYHFVIEILKSNSLLVSIPVLHSIAQTLEYREPKIRSTIDQSAGQIFDTCVERLIRFESLPKDTEHAILSYLREDFETLPELHAFLGNYRRFCTKVTEHLSQEQPIQALNYLLQQSKQTLDNVEALNGSVYSKHAIPIAQLEANVAAIRGGLSGYRHWLIRRNRSQTFGAPQPEHEAEVNESVHVLSSHCTALAGTTYQHPDAARNVIQLMVDITMYILNPEANLVIRIVEHILSCNVKAASDWQNADYDQAVKSFEGSRLTNFQHLAISFPDQIYDRHEEVFQRIDQICQTKDMDDKLKHSYKAIQIILTQRSMQLDENTRLLKLQPLLEPVVQEWTTVKLTMHVTSFEKFCSLIGLDNLVAYVSSAGFNKTVDWSSAKLDDAGAQLRDRINACLTDIPVRMTTSIIAATTESLREDSTAHRVGAKIWEHIIPMMLPNVLALLAQATAFSSEESWASQSADFQEVLRKMLVDRFWQSGISNETKDEFTARVNSSSNTFEGLASTVRGAPRQLRDGCYHIIHGMTRFDKIFFAIPDLAQPLASALFENAHWLSTHHLQRLVSLLDRLAARCPVHCRNSFLPPVIAAAFTCFHTKLTREWERINSALSDNQQNGGSGDLNEEMKADSVVRATTHAFITFASKILASVQGAGPDSFRTIVMNNPATAPPIVNFLIASLRMRDSRCVTITTQIFRSIIPFVAHQQDPDKAELMTMIQQSLATDGLQTAIMSLNDQHFVDIHKDLASLIACIIDNCPVNDDMPTQVLKSLQNMDPVRVDNAVKGIRSSNREREQRAIVLGLLEGIRGVRISELGKLGIGGNRDDAAKKSKHDKGKWLAPGGMEVERSGIVRGNTPPEGGLGNIFGDH